jgi:polysaccharide biosynthesis/export protein
MLSAAWRLSAGLASAVICGAVGGCGGPGPYVWFNDLPAESPPARGEYLIGLGDTLSVRVLGHEDMTLRQKVRPDGRVAFPLIGEVEARGKTPGALRVELEGRLKEYVVSPSVMVNVDDTQPMVVVLLGEVARPGAYPTEANIGLAHALALGGGLTEFATRDRIFVVRQRPAPVRIRFTYEQVSRDDGQAAGFALHPGDLIVVE